MGKVLLPLPRSSGSPYRQTVEVIQFSKSRVLRNTEGTDQQENSTAILQTITNKSMHSMPIIGKEPKETKKYDLLINAYMNSGSRFTGSLFGFRKEAFFFYEPLWKASVWDYYKTPNLACNSISDGCRGSVITKHCYIWENFYSNQTAARVNQKIRALSTVPRNKTVSDFLLGILEKVYKCNFSHFDTLIVKDIAEVPSLSGPSWDPFRVCLKLKRPKGECIRQQEELCKKSTHMVTKVLRMTVGSLEPLLRIFPNLKIVHLFRDPRAVINSRIHSKGYPVRDFNRNAKALCRKMTWDLLEGKELLKKYPDRFKFIFYEDIKSDVLNKTEQLSNFIGMNFQSSEVELLNKVKVNNVAMGRRIKVPGTRASDNAFWWKANIPDNILKNVQKECNTVLEHFGFTIFNSSTELKNSSFPTFRLP